MLDEREGRFLLMSESELLEEVDEYLLYCFYLGFNPEMRVRYKSPARDPDNADENASWSMFTNTSRLDREYAWKDSGTGEFGDIFKLVMLILRCKNKASALEQIKRDFLFGRGVEIARQGVAPPKSVDPARIRLKSVPLDLQDLSWWNQRTGADVKVLELFNVRRVKYYWMYEHQNTPSFGNGHVYSYRIGSHYQLYFPERDRDRRFRNDYTEDHLPGFHQLKYESDTLIITKSMKDIITLYVLGYEAVSPRSENTPIAEKYMTLLKSRYKHIITLFDNDGKHRAWSYDCPSAEIPLETGQKDPSDLYFVFGHDKTKEVIDCIIQKHPAMTDFSGIDLNKPMSRLELEALLEKVYLNQVITVQHVGKKIATICGKIHSIAMDWDRNKEPICIITMNDHRYEFALGFFIQKAQIQQSNGYTQSGSEPG